MSASKKSSTKSAASPAPATKSTAAKTVAKKKTTSAATVRATTPTPVAMLAPKPVAAATPAVKSVAVKPVAAKPVVTTITAKIDIGFGNALYIRGEGPGLSWDEGRLMDCVSSDVWRIVLAESARAYTFKFLVNDLTWSAGPDFSAACGTSITLTPEF